MGRGKKKRHKEKLRKRAARAMSEGFGNPDAEGLERILAEMEGEGVGINSTEVRYDAKGDPIIPPGHVVVEQSEDGDLVVMPKELADMLGEDGL